MTTTPVYLRSEETSVMIAASATGAPIIVHWGVDLGPLTPTDIASYLALRRPGVPRAGLDDPRERIAVPSAGHGFAGTPAIEGMRTAPDPTAPAAMPRIDDWTWQVEASGLSIVGCDLEAGLDVGWRLELTSHGAVRTRTSVTNAGSTPFIPMAVRTVLPVPADATELLDLTGRWCAERIPQRHQWQQGTWSRHGRHGRTGHDATLLMIAGTPNFGFRRGDVWGVTVGWSGDHVLYAERTPEGDGLMGGGELLQPGEIELAPGETYTSPWLVGVTSTRGLDGLSAILHRTVRDSGVHRDRPPPVVMNTWEATYFDHDLDRLKALADAAADIGAERYVLDDGWFRGRRSDTAGLGDWTVDPTVWPKGLHPLIRHVRSRGMDFGLWVEPEMINEDSDLARQHPEWILRGRSDLPPAWRRQHVLDLQQPAAYDHVKAALLALLDEYPIAFLKWDHNRDVIDVTHRGRPAIHGQTTAYYQLLDDIRSAHPAVEIESCASGGGRVDLGVLQRTDRIWASDTLDPLERQRIQRWTGLLVPPEMIGAHVGAPVAPTTGRRHTVGFRAATALLGHFGIEWDLTSVTPDERTELIAWVSLYKQVRRLISGGTLVRPDHPDPAIHVTGVVSPDGADGIFVVVATDMTATQIPAPIKLAGLSDSGHYAVWDTTPAGNQHSADRSTSWLDQTDEERPVVLSPTVLQRAGVQFPILSPETARVIRVRHIPAVSTEPTDG